MDANKPIKFLTEDEAKSYPMNVELIGSFDEPDVIRYSWDQTQYSVASFDAKKGRLKLIKREKVAEDGQG